MINLIKEYLIYKFRIKTTLINKLQIYYDRDCTTEIWRLNFELIII